MSALDFLSYPQEAAYNLARSGGRLFTGQATGDDLHSALPGMLGIGAGLAMAPFSAGLSLPIGMLAAGIGQGAGHAIDNSRGTSRFQATSPSELSKALAPSLGLEEDNPFLEFGVRTATDPLTYLGALGAHKGWGALKNLDTGEELAQLGMKSIKAGPHVPLPGTQFGVPPVGELSAADKAYEAAALRDLVAASNKAEGMMPVSQAHMPLDKTLFGGLAPLPETVDLPPVVGAHTLAGGNLGTMAGDLPAAAAVEDSPLLQALKQSAEGKESMRAGLNTGDTLSPFARKGSGEKPVMPYPGRRQESLMSEPGKSYRIPPPAERKVPGYVEPPVTHDFIPQIPFEETDPRMTLGRHAQQSEELMRMLAGMMNRRA